jgi:uncharacterized membrane protein
MSSLLNVFNESSFALLVTDVSDMIKHLVNIFMHLVLLYGLWEGLNPVFMKYYCGDDKERIEKLMDRNKELTKKVGALEYAMANRGYKLHDDGRMYVW